MLFIFGQIERQFIFILDLNAKNTTHIVYIHHIKFKT